MTLEEIENILLKLGFEKQNYWGEKAWIYDFPASKTRFVIDDLYYQDKLNNGRCELQLQPYQANGLIDHNRENELKHLPFNSVEEMINYILDN